MQVDEILKNEELPQFLIDLTTYNTYERNATTKNFKESILYYFKLCNITVQDSDEKYDKGEKRTKKKPITDFKIIPSLIDEFWSINEDNKLKDCPVFPYNTNQIYHRLIKLQRLGNCTPLQKLAISKYCMIRLFHDQTPISIYYVTMYYTKLAI